MHDVVHTQELPDTTLESLSTYFDIRHVPQKGRPVEEFVAGLGACDGLIVGPGDTIDAELIEAFPNSLAAIASFSAGLDHIDLEAVGERGWAVGYAPDALTETTADIAMYLIMGLVRGASGAETLLRAGEWTGWAPAQIFGNDLSERVLGVVGAGRIGVATARRAAAFGMDIHYWARGVKAEMQALDGIWHENLESLASVSDVLTLHLPSNVETAGLIGPDVISSLRSGSFIVNTARGDILDEPATFAALESGHLGGVGIDVFTGEPHIDRRWFEVPNTILLPHIGSSTHQARRRMGQAVIDHLVSTLKPGDGSD